MLSFVVRHIFPILSSFESAQGNAVDIHLGLLTPRTKSRRPIRAGTAILHDILLECHTGGGHCRSGWIGDTYQEETTILRLTEDGPIRCVSALRNVETVGNITRPLV